MKLFRNSSRKLLHSCKALLVLNLLVLIMISLNFIHSCVPSPPTTETEPVLSLAMSRISTKHVRREPKPTIYAITPTYARWTQKADLTRLSHTLMHLEDFHWIVVEDAAAKSSLVVKLLKNSGLNYTHLYDKTDADFKLGDKDPNWLLPRGVSQRNRGLRWMRENLSPSTDGLLYFMDDDNTYSLPLFKEIRSTKVAAVWPVGLSGGLKFEGPTSCTADKVLKWYTAWKPDRPFPLDMAGFAVHVRLLFEHPTAIYSNRVARGYLESDFLTKLGLSRELVEPKANQCREILVWHTRTEKAKMKQEDRLVKMGKPSDPAMEV